MSDQNSVLVYIAKGQADAQLIQLLLGSFGIETILDQEGVGHAYGLTFGSLGEVQILVSAEKEEEARSVLEAYERGDLEQPSSSPLDEDSSPPIP